jgi:choline kinase
MGRMIGLVLAAGAGRRLRPHTDRLPKALVPVDANRTVLDMILANFAAVDLRDVAVVVGYAAEAVVERRSELERRHGVWLELVHNARAEDWNNAYSLWCAREFLAEGVVLSNGDTVHPVSVEERLLDSRGAPVRIAVDDLKSLGEEEMKIELGIDGDVARISKLLDPQTAAGEYIGVTLIEPEAAEPLTEALEATWRRDPGLYYEDGYQTYVDRGRRIDICPIGEVSWVEVDDKADLIRARAIACRY